MQRACKDTLCYAIMLPGRKSAFRAGFCLESTEIGPPAGRRPDGDRCRCFPGSSPAKRPISGPQALLRNIGYVIWVQGAPGTEVLVEFLLDVIKTLLCAPEYIFCIGMFLSTETPPQKRRLQNRPRGAGNPAGNPQKTSKNQENRQKLRHPAPP